MLPSIVFAAWLFRALFVLLLWSLVLLQWFFGFPMPRSLVESAEIADRLAHSKQVSLLVFLQL